MSEREMTASWTDWRGMVVDGTFYLERYLGGTEHSAVYFTEWGAENKPAAIKLIAAENDADAESTLTRWKLASELNVPSLLRVYHAGRCELDSMRLLYAVMELADENLAAILRERPLNAAEAREMTSGVLEALAALHYKGLVHGQVKPSNIFAVGDQLKISSDSIAHAGSRSACNSAYDAPELASEPLSPSADIWSLGITIVESLTQQRPGIIGADGELGIFGAPAVGAVSGERELSAELPAPFQEIAQHCLMSDRVRRWTVAGVRAHLSPAPASAPTQAPAQVRTAAPEEATAHPKQLRPAQDETKTAQEVATEQSAEAPLPDWVDLPPGMWQSFKPYVPVTFAALVFFATTATLFTVHSSRRGQGHEVAISAKAQPATNASERAASQSATAAAQPKPDNASAALLGAAATSETQRAQAPGSQASWVQAFSPQSNSRPQAMSTSLVGGWTPGSAIEQPTPDVSARARRTIHGRIKVKVKVAVDPTGSVQSATLDSHSSSRYFAGLAMETARRWRFSPAQLNGQNVASEWLLKFEFRRGRTEVHPTPLNAADRPL